MKSKKVSSNCENMDLGDVFLGSGQNTLNDRLRKFAELMARISKHRESLYRRTVCSTADREVVVFDPSLPGPRKMLMFGSNNYLGLAAHPFVKKRVTEAIDTYGVGISGPPLLNGYTSLHHELEERLALFKNAEAAMIFSTGYGANVGMLSGLLRRKDSLICDEYSHASFWDGLRLSGVRPVRFSHNNVDELENLLQRNRSKGDTYVGVEGVYSMDGDVAPLDRIAVLCRDYGAFLIVDDAHGTGVMGSAGKGTAEYFGVDDQVFVQMGTFSKSFGVVGGFVTGTRDIIEYLRYSARSYMFSASLPPMVVAAVLGGLDVIDRDPGIIRQLHENVKYATTVLKGEGFDVSPAAAIIVLKTPPWMNVRKAAERFHQANIFLNAIEYPAVPRTEQRFRISVMATHTKKDIDRLVACVSDVWEKEREHIVSMDPKAA